MPHDKREKYTDEVIWFLTSLTAFVAWSLKNQNSSLGHPLRQTMDLFVAVLLGMALVALASPQPRRITIGGLFEFPGDEQIFQFAVEYVNQKQIMGPDVQFDYIVNTTSYIETFETVQQACRYAETGIMALIGPSTSTSTKAVSPVSTALHLPQITPSATDSSLANQRVHPFLVRMMPPDSFKSRALVAFANHFGWSRFAILTSDTDYGIHGLVEFQIQASFKGWRVFSVLQFHASEDPQRTDATQQLKVIKETGVRIVLLNCLPVFARNVLKQAKELGMVESGWAWIVTATGRIAEPSENNEPNDHLEGLIGIASATRHGTLRTDFAAAWNQSVISSGRDANPWTITTVESTYIVDAVLTIAYAMRDLYKQPSNAPVSQEALSCDQQTIQPWAYGDLLLNSIKKVKGEGIANDIHFNADAGPKDPGFVFLNFRNGSWEPVGTWEAASGLKLPKKDNITFMGGRPRVLDHVSSLQNKTLNVVTAIYEPFIGFPVENYNYSDIQPDQIEGYCVDMLNKLAEMSGFKYRIHREPNDDFGYKDPETRQWNGMIRELLDRKADIAVSGITINRVREIAVDFTKPFLDIGFSFILKVPEEEEMRPFRFLDPLSSELWMHVLLTAVFVGVYLSFINRLSPYDYHGSFVYRDSHKEALHLRSQSLWRLYNSIKDRETRKLNLSKSIMSSVSCLLKQGAENYPKSFSGRVTSTAWWVAVVFIVASYTANLAAYMHAKRAQTSINSVEDLAAQSEIAYGITGEGSVVQYFMDSKRTLYQDMWYYVSSRGHVYRNETKYFSKVRAGGYAHISESASLEYNCHKQPCNTIQTVGRVFAKQGYGIALQEHSPYKEELSTHILHLRESGYFDDLYKKWFEERSECGDQDRKESDQNVPKGQLQVSHMLGVFYLVYGGMLVGFALLLVEYIVKAFQSLHKTDQDVTLCGTLWRHLRLCKDDFWKDVVPQVLQCNWFKQSKSDATMEKGPDVITVSDNPLRDEIKCLH